MNKDKLVKVIWNCLRRSGFADAEANKILSEFLKIKEWNQKRDQSFWSYTDFWGAEGPDCINMPR